MYIFCDFAKVGPASYLSKSSICFGSYRGQIEFKKTLRPTELLLHYTDMFATIILQYLLMYFTSHLG